MHRTPGSEAQGGHHALDGELVPLAVLCGPGIGRNDWSFRVHGSKCDEPWEYLVPRIRGEGGRDVPWNLNPDYQRGPVWTKDQQEKFIGHVLSGGEAPLIYVQRYERPDNAPEGSDYWDLPLEVIDGQQRLRAITAFIEGEIGAQVCHSGKWHTYYFSQMHEGERSPMDLCSRVVYVDLSRTDRLRFYLRLNIGVAHTEEELDRVRKMLVEEES